MPKLVAPDGVLFVINDTGPGQADVAALAERRKDLPPPKNLNQLLGWVPGPHGARAMANNWQLLDKVKWAENDGEYIPLVGFAANALMIFNRHCGTSHIMTSSFRKMLSGDRPFEGGWIKMPNGQTPADALGLTDGSSLVGLRRARSRVQARAANAALNPTPMMVEVGATADGSRAAGAQNQQVRVFESHGGMGIFPVRTGFWFKPFQTFNLH